MTQPFSLEFGGIHLGTKTAESPREADPEAPFRILLLGDFAGRASRGGGKGPDWKPVVIDRDNFEEVMARLSVEIHLNLPEPLVLRFAELDDFHPDRLSQRVPIFDDLRRLRDRLQNPRTFAEAAAEVRSWGKAPTEPSASEAPAEKPLANVSSEELLEMMLSGSSEAVAQPAANDPFQDYVRRMVAPHLVPGASPDESALVEIVDEVLAVRMRALLHHPVFQAIESAWRALALLVRRLDTDGKLKLFLLDVSRDELAADLKAADLSTSRAYRVLVEQTVGTPGGEPWAVLVGDYVFRPTLADAALAVRLAHLSQAAGAPFLAAAHPSFVGVESLAAASEPANWSAPADAKAAELWAALRQLPQVAYLGLALPRFLLRQPYGKEGDVPEEFAFEEMTPNAGHEEYLWGNSAYLCGLLLGQGFEHMGWRLRPGIVADCDGLPAWVRDVDGERELLPCAEVLLRDKAAKALWDRGLIVVQSVQGRDAVRVAQFVSLAEPAKGLAGRWHR